MNLPFCPLYNKKGAPKLLSHPEGQLPCEGLGAIEYPLWFSPPG